MGSRKGEVHELPAKLTAGLWTACIPDVSYWFLPFGTFHFPRPNPFPISSVSQQWQKPYLFYFRQYQTLQIWVKIKDFNFWTNGANFILRLSCFPRSASMCMGKLLVGPVLGNVGRALQHQWTGTPWRWRGKSYLSFQRGSLIKGHWNE